jgi:hypothetical protein
MRDNQSVSIFPQTRAAVLFDSLNSPTTAVLSADNFESDASFATGASTFYATDIALLLSQAAAPDPGDTLNVSLEGGVPLADLSFDPTFGLNVFPEGGPVLGSVQLPVSDLSPNSAASRLSPIRSIGSTSKLPAPIELVGW